LVEDNPSDEKLTVLAFKRSNLDNEVVVARDGAAALDLLLGPEPLDPAIVLLDLSLPRIDGIEVLRRIRANARTATLPVVILTSSTLDEDLIRGYSAGANAYVRKPVDFKAFVDAARTLGCFWLLLNEPMPRR
jgi:two-component system response regulator